MSDPPPADTATDTPADPAALLAGLPDLVITIAPDFTVAWVNDAVTRVLGHEREATIGRPITDFLHPDELDRALNAMGGWQRYGDPAGVTGFRLPDNAGEWHDFDITAAGVRQGDEEHFVVLARPADYPQAVNQVLARLLAGAPRHDLLEPVLDVLTWKPFGMHVAIAWHEPTAGDRHVSTGLPAALAGADGSVEGPWAEARRTGEPVVVAEEDVAARLSPEQADLARELDRGNLWVVPVPDHATGIPALITLFSIQGGRPATGHSYGMAMAELYVELILQWSRQADALRAAAHTDALTGLPNRRAFFDVLESTAGGGALLYCDLDEFKAVNDELGHGAGDEVLRLVAARLRAAIRPDDLVARTGGDEFVVLAPGVDDAQAGALAERLCAVTDEPFHLSTGEVVRLGITVGLAHAPSELSEHVLADADRALLAAKGPRLRAR